MSKCACLIISIVLASGCYPPAAVDSGYRQGNGQLVIYLQPLPQEANRLQFTLSAISVTHEDGSETPLTLLIDEIIGAEFAARQKRLAAGYLPEGSYTGLSVGLKKAFFQGEEGEAALFIPQEVININHPITMKREQSLVLFLSFRPAGAKTVGVNFIPVFSLMDARRVLTTLTGYVSNGESNTLSVFDKRSMEIANVISTGRRPQGIALDARRARAFVALMDDDAIQEIDVVEGKILQTLSLSFGDEPIDVALSSDGRTLVSANRGSNTASIIDATSLIEIERIAVGNRPVSAEITPSGRLVFVMNSYSNALSVIDLSRNMLAGSVAVEGSPLRGAFSRDGRTLYVISQDSPNLTVVDTAQRAATRKIFIGMGAASLKVDTRTDLVYVGKKFGGEIAIIDPRASLAIDAIWIEGGAEHMTIDKEENSLFVLLPGKRLLQKINLTSKRSQSEIEVGDEAYELVVMGER